MKHQDPYPIETLESQMLESPLECEESSSDPRSYRIPHVLLVGKAKCLMAGSPVGDGMDYEGGFNPHHGGDPTTIGEL